MTTDNFYFYLQNRLVQTSQTGGQWYSDTSPFSIPCFSIHAFVATFTKARACPSETLRVILCALPPNIRLGRKRLTVTNATAKNTTTLSFHVLLADAAVNYDRKKLCGAGI
jgi:hypothetical protein